MTGDVIKRKRKEMGLTQEELGKLLGVNRAAVNKWETGRVRNIKREKLLQLSRILKVSPNELLDDYDEKPKTKRIPVLGRVAAGVPIDRIEEVIGYEEIDREASESADYFALRIKGDSMEPRIYDGDTVIVRKQNDAESGDIVIASINGEDATCKRLKKMEGGIMLVPLNRRYDPFIFSSEQAEEIPVSIIGKVVELRCRF